MSKRSGRQLRPQRANVPMPSRGTLLNKHVSSYSKNLECMKPLGGPVTRLSPEDYFASKITEAAQKAML